jgi:dTMP kinase
MLICIEGIDGSGKSTLAQRLKLFLQQNGNTVLLTKEPGGSALGKQLRSILQTQPMPISPISEFLLFAADRAQHVQEVIKPAIAQGTVVITDRMGDSSLVYQGYGRGIDKQMITMVNEWALQGITPDLTLYVKIDGTTAAQRVHKRGELSAFEREQADFADRLISGFNELYHDRADVITLDGTQSPDDIILTAGKAVSQWMNQHRP